MLSTACRSGLDALRGEMKPLIEPIHKQVDDLDATVMCVAENGQLAAEHFKELEPTLEQLQKTPVGVERLVAPG